MEGIEGELRTWCSCGSVRAVGMARGRLALSLGQGTEAQEADCHGPERSLNLALSLRGCMAGRQYKQRGNFEDPESHRALGSLDACPWLLWRWGGMSLTEQCDYGLFYPTGSPVTYKGKLGLRKGGEMV